MKKEKAPRTLAIPVDSSDGLQSLISDHFGRASGFLLIDASGNSATYLDTAENRGASECAPIDALVRAGARAVAARSMGRGALRRCHEAGLHILKASGRSVADYLASMAQGLANDFPDEAICDHKHGAAQACHEQGSSAC